MFKGSFTALITPYAGSAVDMDAVNQLINWQIDEGTHGLVACGTTGESPTLSHQEHRAIVDTMVKTVAGRVPVIASAGSNSTAESIDLARYAADANADGLMVVLPYYNKPNQEGLYQHFKAVADATPLPIIIYNIPPRSVIEMSVETMARLASDCPTIVGVKDATMNLSRPSRERLACGEQFNLLSGEDATALGYMAHGGHGCISVTANAAPRLCAEFQTACLAGDYATALQIQDRLMPLHDALFLEPNPAGIKYAVSLLGHCSSELRLPMVPLTNNAKGAIERAMISAGLLT